MRCWILVVRVSVTQPGGGGAGRLDTGGTSTCNHCPAAHVHPTSTCQRRNAAACSVSNAVGAPQPRATGAARRRNIWETIHQHTTLSKHVEMQVALLVPSLPQGVGVDTPACDHRLDRCSRNSSCHQSLIRSRRCIAKHRQSPAAPRSSCTVQQHHCVCRPSWCTQQQPRQLCSMVAISQSTRSDCRR